MEKVTAEKVVEILKANGIIVNKEEAILILEFLRKLASIAINKNEN